MGHSRLVSAFGVLAAITAVSAAHAQTPPDDAASALAGDCSMFQGEGERARAAGKLREARAHFLECARCGSLSCGELATAMLDEIPTVLVVARDRAGREILDATVTIDGAQVAAEVDGKAIALDPGTHTVEVRQRTLASTKRVTLAAREKAIVVELLLDRPDPEAATRDIEGHTIWPWAVAFAGAFTIGAGIGLIALAPSLPAGCDADTRECTPEANESPTSQSLRQRRDQAGRSIGQPIVGGVVIGAGAAIATLGLAWHFLEKTTPVSARGARFSPLLGFGTYGVGATGTF